ncbi:hypothetical protein PVAP13_5NG095881 [Panicum virgatum]|uniref:Uncharacterized protein n=1 Tax=Panicum virgatum TaxID=38727 RepID=A0A8T0RP91_PANVG|nr:hypothetical protein PVAP13_5NG095881 [Panicum virgatum]
MAGIVPVPGDHERLAPEHHRRREVDDGGLEGPPHGTQGEGQRDNSRDEEEVRPGREELRRLDESSRRERRDENEVLDVPVPPRHWGAPHELQRHRAAQAVAEEDDLLALVPIARVLDEPRQLPEVAGEDLGQLAGHWRGIAEVLGRLEEGVTVAVPDILQLLPEDLEAPVEGPKLATRGG